MEEMTIGFHPTFSALGRASKLPLLSLNENVAIFSMDNGNAIYFTSTFGRFLSIVWTSFVYSFSIVSMDNRWAICE